MCCALQGPMGPMGPRINLLYAQDSKNVNARCCRFELISLHLNPKLNAKRFGKDLVNINLKECISITTGSNENTCANTIEPNGHDMADTGL